MLHLSGRTEADLRAWYDGRPLRRTDLVPDAAGAAAVGTVVRAVARDEPQSGPGYFVLAHAWVRLAGGDLPAVRALSALASVLALGLVHRLARRTFARPDVALAAAALMALSPLHLRYAQEARPYALWSVALLVWALAAWRARERPAAARFVGCGLACGAALAIQPLSLLAVPAVAALAGGRDRRFWIATGVATLAWSAWAVVGWLGRATVARTTGWAGEPIAFAALGRAWLGMLTSLFYRPGGEGGLLGAGPWSAPATLAWLALGVAAPLLAAAALRGLGGVPVGAVRRFVGRLTVLPWALLALVDLGLGGRRSTVARYLVPGWIGLELAVAHRLGAGRRWRPLLLLVLLLGALTALGTRPAAFWWDTDAPRLRALARAAADVDAVAAAVVVTDLPPLAVVELADRLADRTTFRLGTSAPATIAEPEWSRVVLVSPSAALLAAARAAAGPARALVAAGGDGMLWRVGERGDG